MKDLNLGEKTTRIAEAALITTFMTLIIILGYNMFPIIILFYPVPFIILGVRNNTKYSIYSILASSILIGILIDIFTGILAFLVFGLFSIVMAYMINKKYRPQQVLIGGILASVVTTIIAIVIIGYLTGISFLSEINTALMENVKLQLDMLEQMEISSYEFSMVKDVLLATVNYIIIIIPATIIIFSIFIVYMNYWMSTAILRRLGNKSIEVPKFMHFRLPNNAVMGSALILILALLFRTMKILYYETIFINTVILISFVFFIQGLSVLVFLMNKKNMHKVPKIILIFLIIISVPLGLIVSIIGFVDAAVDFRKLKRKE